MQLYALCDQDLLDTHNVSIKSFIATCKKHNASVIQYRNKSADIATIKSQLILLRELYDGYLIINDAYELIDYCDGVHLGQEDLLKIDADITKAVSIVRQIIGDDKILGISTHNAKEIEITNTLDLNYIGLGAYRATNTKDVSHILGDSLDTLAKDSVHKVAAIGGVKLSDKFLHVSYLVIGSALLEN